MKLKTLKDFEDSDNEDWICAIELKAEAVKWVKECSHCCGILEGRKFCIACQRTIKMNNITEDDMISELKGGIEKTW